MLKIVSLSVCLIGASLQTNNDNQYPAWVPLCVVEKIKQQGKQGEAFKAYEQIARWLEKELQQLKYDRLPANCLQTEGKDSNEVKKQLNEAKKRHCLLDWTPDDLVEQIANNNMQALTALSGLCQRLSIKQQQVFSKFQK